MGGCLRYRHPLLSNQSKPTNLYPMDSIIARASLEEVHLPDGSVIHKLSTASEQARRVPQSVHCTRMANRSGVLGP